MRVQAVVRSTLLHIAFLAAALAAASDATAQQPEAGNPPIRPPVLTPVEPPPPAPRPAPKPPPDRWKVSAEMSYTDQSGNRALRLLTGGLSFSHLKKDDFEMEGTLRSRYGESEDQVVARNHFASLSLDLHPKHTFSPFLFANAERDPFQRLNVRLGSGAGAKYTPVRGKRGDASLSLALLYSFEALRATVSDPDPERRSLARWSLRAQGSHDVGSGITLREATYFQPAWGELADYLLRSETGMKVMLTKRLALSLEYSLDRNARPPEGVNPDNRLFKTGLIIDF